MTQIISSASKIGTALISRGMSKHVKLASPPSQSSGWLMSWQEIPPWFPAASCPVSGEGAKKVAERALAAAAGIQQPETELHVIEQAQ